MSRFFASLCENNACQISSHQSQCRREVSRASASVVSSQLSSIAARTPSKRARSSSAAPAVEMSNGASSNGHTDDAAAPAAPAAGTIGDVQNTESGLVAVAPTAETPAGKGRGKRPRISDIQEEGADGQQAGNVSTRTLRTRAKTPVKEETPAASSPKRRRRDSTPGTGTKGRPRVSATPKPPKIGMNPLPTPFGAIRNFPDFNFDYTLPQELDPTKEGKHPLSVMIFGTGDFGQLGLGPDFAGEEIQRPKLHAWFQQHITSTKGATDGANGESSTNGASSPDLLLGKHGVTDAVCGGMHTLVIDSNGQVSKVQPCVSWLTCGRRYGAGASETTVFSGESSMIQAKAPQRSSRLRHILSQS